MGGITAIMEITFGDREGYLYRARPVFIKALEAEALG
jgi:hypothetical protein